MEQNEKKNVARKGLQGCLIGRMLCPRYGVCRATYCGSTCRRTRRMVMRERAIQRMRGA